MQHDMGPLTCPACQCSMSVQLDWQFHEEQQQQQQRRQQLLESQTTFLESLKIFDQGEEAGRQSEFGKACRLCKSGLAGAIHALCGRPATRWPRWSDGRAVPQPGQLGDGTVGEDVADARCMGTGD